MLVLLTQLAQELWTTRRRRFPGPERKGPGGNAGGERWNVHQKMDERAKELGRLSVNRTRPNTASEAERPV